MLNSDFPRNFKIAHKKTFFFIHIFLLPFSPLTMLSILHAKKPLASKHVFSLVKNTMVYRNSSTCQKSKEGKTPIISTKFWSDPVTWQRTRINTLR